MRADSGWRGAGDDAMTWLTSVATDAGQSYRVGPMPDKVFVLHPLSVRVDGQPFDEPTTILIVDDEGTVLIEGPDEVEPALRRMRWQEYARRRNIPLLRAGGRPGLHDALPGVWDDNHVLPPDEGELADLDTRKALFDVLMRHSADGPQTWCTAYFDWFWVGDPTEALELQPPNVLRGRLGAYPELFDLPEYGLPPQNLWPDDHRWVLESDVDSWATAISGTTALAEDIIASSELEAIRLPHLH